MNNELSKALDGAMADAEDMGELAVENAFYCPERACWLANVWGKPITPTDSNQFARPFCQTTGHSKPEALRRARLIVESVNGRAAMAKRIAELEGALGTLADKYWLAENGFPGHELAEVPVELMHNAIKVLKGGA